MRIPFKTDRVMLSGSVCASHVLGQLAVTNMTNFHLVTSSQFWASGQYLHSEINPHGPHNGAFNSTLIK